MTEATPLPEGLLEQYKLAVEMADRVSARRATANSFFLSVESAVAALLALTDKQRWPIAAAAIVVAMAWWLLLRNYRVLNGAKFDVIHAMEKRLPRQPYTDEWKIIDAPGVAWHKRYRTLSGIEQAVPVVFIVLFAVVLVS